MNEDIRHDMPGGYLRHGPWLTWQPMPAGFDVPARPKPLGGRKRDVGEARPGAAAREREEEANA